MMPTPDQGDPNRPVAATLPVRPALPTACVVPPGYTLTPVGPPGTLYFSDGFNLQPVAPPAFPFEGNPPYLRFGSDGAPYWSPT